MTAVQPKVNIIWTQVLALMLDHPMVYYDSENGYITLNPDIIAPLIVAQNDPVPRIKYISEFKSYNVVNLSYPYDVMDFLVNEENTKVLPVVSLVNPSRFHYGDYVDMIKAETRNIIYYNPDNVSREYAGKYSREHPELPNLTVVEKQGAQPPVMETWYKDILLKSYTFDKDVYYTSNPYDQSSSKPDYVEGFIVSQNLSDNFI
jgi:hypothetical protein